MRAARFAYVGCLTSEKRKGRGKGISVYSVNRADLAWDLVQVHDTIENPGFLAIGRSQRCLYAGHGSSDQVSAHVIDPQNGRLRFLNSQTTKGNNALHITVDPTERFLLAATGPGIAVFPINKDGSLAPASDIVTPPGDPSRGQSSAKPHQVLFDSTGRFVLSMGKAVDRIFVHRFDYASGKLLPHQPSCLELRNSYAPRHAVMHPTQPYLYVIEKKGRESAVAAYRWDAEKGELQAFQMVLSLPPPFTPDNNEGAEIAIEPSGRFLYVSNRGHDSIATFSIDSATGELAPVDWQPTGGKKPRFFALQDGRMYVANQNSDTITVFDVDAHRGKLERRDLVVETGTPLCIVFAS